jgi:RNA polymerase sigma factor (TIGR02999 family)
MAHPAHINITQLLDESESGNSRAADQLLPLVYEELRQLAARKLAHEKPGQTLGATALVHEAYLRLVGPDDHTPQHWESRRHFFAAAAEAMRRILVENARRKARLRHGGGRVRADRENSLQAVAVQAPDDDVLAVHEALDDLEQMDSETVKVVKLHYFLGLTFAETAELLGIAERTAYRNWSFARAWLYERLKDKESTVVEPGVAPPLGR